MRFEDRSFRMQCASVAKRGAIVLAVATAVFAFAAASGFFTASVLLSLAHCIVAFFLFEAAYRAADAVPRGARRERLVFFVMFMGGSFAVFTSLYSIVLAPAALQTGIAVAGVLEPSVEARLLVSLIVKAPNIIAWLMLWALIGPALAMFAAGFEKPIARWIMRDYGARLAALLSLSLPLRLLAAAAAGRGGAAAEPLLAGAPLEAPPVALLLSLFAGAAIAAALLVEAVAAHRAFWAAHDPDEDTVRAFE